MLQMFPELFAKVPVREVGDYPINLLKSLSACAPPMAAMRRPVAVLTPGIRNSAYFEQHDLADQMGAELVEGHDLRVVDGRVAVRTTQGYRAIDVLYRRVDDDFLDPLVRLEFDAGGAQDMGRLSRERHPRCQCAGTGIADDKALCWLHARHHRILHRRKGAVAQRADVAMQRARTSARGARPASNWW